MYRSTFLRPSGSCAGADVGGGNPLPTASIVLRNAIGQGIAAATTGVPVTPMAAARRTRKP